MAKKEGKLANANFQCSPISIKYVGKGLASSNDTVNPYSIRKSGKKPA